MIALLLSLIISSAAAGPVILHSNDNMGELEPCGCRRDPQGGYVRQWNFQKTLPKKDLLVLDSGDLLFESLDLPKLLQEQALAQAEFVVQARNLLGTSAATPGEKDFALGVASFKKLAAQAKFPFLSCNLMDDK